MKADRIKLKDCETWEQCKDAVEAIESDYQNIQGGFKAWNSGYETHLTKTAQKKVDALERKMDRLLDDAQN